MFNYEDAKGVPSQRKVWPLGIVYLEASSVLLAWCHLREDFRSFRLDRIISFNVTSESLRPRRVAMLRDYLVRLRRDMPETGRNTA